MICSILTVLTKRDSLPNGGHRDVVLFRSSKPGKGLRQRKAVREFDSSGALKDERIEVFTRDVAFTAVDGVAYVRLEPVVPPDHLLFASNGPLTPAKDSPIVYRLSTASTNGGDQVEIVTVDISLLLDRASGPSTNLPTVAEWFIDRSTGLILGMRNGGRDGNFLHSDIYTKAEPGGAEDDSLYRLPEDADVQYVNSPFDLRSYEGERE